MNRIERNRISWGAWIKLPMDVAICQNVAAAVANAGTVCCKPGERLDSAILLQAATFFAPTFERLVKVGDEISETWHEFKSNLDLLACSRLNAWNYLLDQLQFEFNVSFLPVNFGAPLAKCYFALSFSSLLLAGCYSSFTSCNKSAFVSQELGEFARAPTGNCRSKSQTTTYVLEPSFFIIDSAQLDGHPK